MSKQVPQPHPSRITPFAGHPIVVGITATQPDLVVLTAAEWARALGTTLYFAYSDPTRYTVQEFKDGTVQHAAIDPDIGDDDAWRPVEQALVATIERLLVDDDIEWEFRFLAGRPDRALTHLARAVDAAAIVVGTRSGRGAGLHEFMHGAVGHHLSHHQHRPVLLVPLSVVDWKSPLP